MGSCWYGGNCGGQKGSKNEPYENNSIDENRSVIKKENFGNSNNISLHNKMYIVLFILALALIYYYYIHYRSYI